MNGWDGEVIEYDASKSHPYKVRFDDPQKRLAMQDWWFGESELKPHVLSTCPVLGGSGASGIYKRKGIDYDKMWEEEFSYKGGTNTVEKTCTCGADKVYGSKVTAFHHAPYCDKFKHKDNI